MISLRMIVLALFVLISKTVSAQNKKLGTITTTPITNATIDRAGELYLTLENGEIARYSKDGELLHKYRHALPPTLFEPRDGARIFAYYRNDQQYLFLNPLLNSPVIHLLDSAWAIDPYLVCTSGDYHLWILDRSDWSLKKVNPKESTVDWEAPIKAEQLKNKPAFSSLREYQNFLFLLDHTSGILIFNHLGKQIKALPEKDLTYFNFFGGELYYKKNDKLHFMDLFTTERRTIPTDPSARIVLLSDERMFRIYQSTVEIYEYTPD